MLRLPTKDGGVISCTPANMTGQKMRMRQFGKFVALRLLHAYKWAISPLLPPACRYVPTCSEYAMEAVERYGVVRGGFMALVRLLRCHPFAHGGYDPVVKSGRQVESHNPHRVSAQNAETRTGQPACEIPISRAV